MTLSSEALNKMTRSKLRYAIFRVKAGTQDQDHQAIYDSYADQLNEFGFDAEDFTKEWDISKINSKEIVTGKIARKYNREVSLFAVPGIPKE